MFLQLKNISKQYHHRNGTAINALSNVSVTIEQGQFATISGPSGSGKSTLLFTMGGLLRPSSGNIIFNGQPLHDANDITLSEFRKNHVGYVMQNYCLVPYLTAEENVMIPLSLLQKDKAKQKETARELLATVGLSDRIEHYPKELSSGQQQRVAIARALSNNPSLILADEPTGNLDPSLAAEILSLLKRLNEEKGITIVMVTHSPEAASYGNIQIQLKDGKMADAHLSLAKEVLV
ncbi:MAG: ABC transporter ATP-binding protein [Saprospiraceae bacterium]|nr:MAG: ABC transporter ATP-binding protein [Saprospiraceae bacterium]